MWFCVGFSVSFSVLVRGVRELCRGRLGHCWWAWSSWKLLLVSFLFWWDHAYWGDRFVQGHNILPWLLSPWCLIQDQALWTSVLGFGRPSQDLNLSWYDVDWEMGGGEWTSMWWGWYRWQVSAVVWCLLWLSWGTSVPLGEEEEDGCSWGLRWHGGGHVVGCVGSGAYLLSRVGLVWHFLEPVLLGSVVVDDNFGDLGK